MKHTTHFSYQFLILIFTLCIVGRIKAQDPVTYEPAFPNLRFAFPTEIQNANDESNRIFVVEQPGRILVFTNDESTRSAQTFLDITDIVSFSSGQEIGLLGLAFHPDYKENGYFYVYHTRSSSVSGVRVEVVLARYQVSSSNPNRADAESRLDIFSFDKNQNNSNHNGGKIAFGPDGYLYASIGDGGGGGDPKGNAQNLNNIFGKILRIDVDLDGNNPIENNPDEPNGNYEIPSDNPRVGSSGLDELYAWGIRNTWKFSFDPSTERLWGADVGQGKREEINLIQKGGNYGWNRFEGTTTFRDETRLVTSPDSKPVFEYNRDNGDVSITGGYVYRGSSDNTTIKNKYIFGDFVSGRVWALDYNSQNENASRTLLFRTTGGIRVSSFGLDESGELYFSGYDESTQIYKIIAGNGQNQGVIAIDGMGSFEPFQDGTNGIVDALTFSGNTTYISGQFDLAGNTTVSNIAAYTVGEGYSSLENGANGRVSALAVDENGNLYAGGDFTNIGGVAANHIAVWNGRQWNAIGEGTNGPVAKIGIDTNNTIYVGGAFENAGGIEVNNIAKYDGSWEALTDSETGISGTNNEIRSIAFDEDGVLYLGGNFDNAGGRTANRIATYNGSQWSTLGQGTSGFVQAIGITDEFIYAGGNFSTAGSSTVNRLARWNRNENRWEKVGNGVSGNVNSIQIQDGFVYVAGNFETVNTADDKIYKVNNIARWNSQSGWQALGTGKATGTDNQIRSLISNGENSIIIGGNFNTAGIIDASNVAVWTDNPGIIDGGIYEMEPQHNRQLRLDVRDGGNSPNSTLVDGYPRHGRTNQQWKFVSVGEDIYEIQPQNVPEKRLDVAGGRTGQNTEIHVYDQHGRPNQLWRAIPVSNSIYEFEPQNGPGMRLAIFELNGRPRALSRNADGSDRQRWRLVPSSGNKLMDSPENRSFSIYPNPFTDTATLALEIDSFKKGELKITNLIGQVVQVITFDADQTNIKIDRKNMASGIYICSLRVDGDLIQTQKLVLE